MRPGPVGRLVRRMADLWNVPEAWTTINRANVTDYTRTGRTVRTEGWESHPVVQSCTRAIVDLVQAVPLEVYAGTDDEITLLPNHPLTRLLHNPAPTSPNLPGSRFIGLTALHVLLYGNALWFIQRSGQGNRGKPSGLKLIHPEYLRSAEYSEAEDRIVRYDWTTPETGTPRLSVAEDIVHFADLAGAGWLFGYPRAAAALGDIMADHEATRYVRQIVSNDGGSAQIFHMAEGATREQAEGAEARWREKRIQRGERGMALFMPGTVKSETIGFNLQQLEFPDLRRVAREDICTAFSVDPRVVGIASAGSDGGLSGVQYREARRRLIAQAVSPLMFLIEGHLNHWLAPEYGEVRVRFSPDGLSELTEDETETSQRAISEYQAGVRTLEEARRLVALPPERDPADHIKAGLMGELTVADVTVLGLASAQKALEPAPEPAPASEAETQQEDEAEPGEEALPPPPARTALPLPVSRVALTPEQRTATWQDVDALARQHEAPMEAAARACFAGDAKRVARIFSTQRTLEVRGITPQEAELLHRLVRKAFSQTGDRTAAWAERMGVPIEAAVEAGAASTGFAIIHGPNPRMPRVVADRTARLSELVGETTAQQIEAVMQMSQQEGWSLSHTADVINETVFGGLAANRAATIARTETISALNHGRFTAAQETGFITEVEWLTQQDNLVRDSHMPLDATRRPLGEAFPNGCRFPGDPGGKPGEVINCYLPGTLVAGNFRAGIRSEYAGPAVELVTRSGQRLAVTANHPILTTQGLRPARTIGAGSELIADRRVVDVRRTAQAHQNESPSRVEDVFESLRVGSPALRRHLAGDDLHGDAAWVKGEVDIVAPNRLLLLDAESSSDEDVGQGVFVLEAMSQALHSGDSTSDLTFDRIALSPPGRPRSLQLGNDGSTVALAPFQPLCLGPSPDLYAMFAEASRQAEARNTAGVTELLDGGAGLVCCDEVLQVRHFEFRGHVYDLETDSGLMIANGIVSSNCRCIGVYH